jgi:hypothetical protein
MLVNLNQAKYCWFAVLAPVKVHAAGAVQALGAGVHKEHVDSVTLPCHLPEPAKGVVGYLLASLAPPAPPDEPVRVRVDDVRMKADRLAVRCNQIAEAQNHR